MSARDNLPNLAWFVDQLCWQDPDKIDAKMLAAIRDARKALDQLDRLHDQALHG